MLEWNNSNYIAKFSPFHNDGSALSSIRPTKSRISTLNQNFGTASQSWQRWKKVTLPTRQRTQARRTSKFASQVTLEDMQNCTASLALDAHTLFLYVSLTGLFPLTLDGVMLTNHCIGVIFAGGMLGFSLSQLPDLHYDTIKEAGILPGDWYYFRKGHLRVGLIMHLATVLPAGIILILQFVPAIRQKLILFHRINGYIVILLLLASNVSVCVVLPHKQGGGSRIATQTSEVFLTIITTIGIVMAWINIRRKQIDQHRKWMLRTVFYYGTAVTSRVVTLITSQLISRGDNYDGVWSCDELDFLYTDLGEPFPEAEYPQCFSNGTLDRGLRVAVKATHLMTKPEQFATSNTQPFGASVSSKQPLFLFDASSP